MVAELWNGDLSRTFKMTPSFALVGINGYADVHLGYLKKLVAESIARMAGAVVLPYEQTPEKMAWFAEKGVPVFDSLEALYAACVPDVVFLPVGIASHLPLTEFCLAHGSNVMVEKPLAGFSAAADRMIAARDKAGKFVAVGFQHMYLREVQRLKQLLVDGRLGRVQSIVSSGIWPRDNAYYSRNGWAGRIRNDEGVPVLDSPVNNAFAHYVNIPLFLAARSFAATAHPAEVSAQLYRSRKTIEYFDTCGIQCVTDDGVRIGFYFSHASVAKRLPHITVFCEKGKVEFEPCTAIGWTAYDDAGAPLESCPLPDISEQVFRDVLARVSDPSVFIYTPELAVEHTVLMERAAEFPVRDIPETALRDVGGVCDTEGLVSAFDSAIATMGPLELDF